MMILSIMDEESDQSIPAIPKNSPPTIASVPLAVTTKNSTAPQHRSFHRSYTCASPTTGPNLQQSSKLPCAPKPLNVDYIKEIMDHLKKMDLNHCPKIEALCYSCIVLPSIDLDPKEMQRFATPADLEGYEERQLYTLLLLQDPNVRLIFLSSLCVDPEVVSYYLSLLNINPRECLPRLFMLSPNESVSKPLSKKILARPQLLRTIRDIALENATHVGLCGYTGSPASIELAETLGIRLLATRNVKSLHFGTKQGSKEIFNACNVPSAPGTPSNHDDDLLTQGDISKSQTRYWTEHCRYIRTPKDLSMGIARQIKNFNIKPKRWMIKLNQGFSGRGNAILDLQQVQEHCYEDIEDMANDIETRFPTLRFECSAVTWDGNSFTGFRNQMKRIGCIGEAFLEGDSVRSPSVQGVISHDDSGGPRVRILSTHEQVLNGQTYFGCIFPAYNDYRKNLIEYGLRIGTELAKNGGEGNFSVDFIASRLSCKTWNLEAVEINLRTGGTTHPYMLLELLCKGKTDEDGLYHSQGGKLKFYIATDGCRIPALQKVRKDALLHALLSGENALAEEIKWNTVKQNGVVFHLFRFVDLNNMVGFTCIGSTREEAEEMNRKTIHFLTALGEQYDTLQ